MATGALDGQGIYQYGEDDKAALFSDLLNLLAGSTSAQIAADRVRLGVIETKQAYKREFDGIFQSGSVPSNTIVHTQAVPALPIATRIVCTVTAHLGNGTGTAAYSLGATTTAGALTAPQRNTIDAAAGKFMPQTFQFWLDLPANTAATISLTLISSAAGYANGTMTCQRLIPGEY